MAEARTENIPEKDEDVSFYNQLIISIEENLRATVFLIVLFILVPWPVVKLYMGMKYINSCSYKPMIPIWLVISALKGLIGYALLILLVSHNKTIYKNLKLFYVNYQKPYSYHNPTH
jgi:hypothetical protein